MKKLPPDHPRWEDGPVPESLRDLLEAGHRPELEDYDFDAGLSQHLSHVRAGTPTPEWARELLGSGAGGTGAAGTTTGAAGAGTAAGSGLKLLPFIIAPLVSAGLVATVMLTSPEGGREASGREVSAAKKTAGAESAPAKAELPSAQPPVVALAPTAAARSHSTGPVEQSGEPGAAPEPSEAELRSEAALHAIRRTADARRASKPVASSQAKLAPDSREQDLSPDGVAELPASPRRAAQAVQPEAAPEAPAESQPVPAPRPAPKKVVDDSRLEREMGMLAMAQRVLTSDPERALRLARQGEQEFAGSMFMQERQQVLLLALIELGRMDEARRLAKPYLQRYPNGPFSDRVRRALANASNKTIR